MRTSVIRPGFALIPMETKATKATDVVPMTLDVEHNLTVSIGMALSKHKKHVNPEHLIYEARLAVARGQYRNDYSFVQTEPDGRRSIVPLAGMASPSAISATNRRKPVLRGGGGGPSGPP